jgi:tRNA dimethylallyltransferase
MAGTSPAMTISNARKMLYRKPMRKPAAILIAGPTASGKSALALALAEKFGGVIINADSMQVYGDLRIITARPTPEEEARASHRLYGHVDAAENYSVGRWCVDVQAALAEAGEIGKLPIIVGGTGLYFKALTLGLAAVPPISADVRNSIRERLERDGIAPLYAELARRDPSGAARLKPNDRTRIARALEVLEATGRSLADWHREGMQPILDAERAMKIFLVPEREELHRRIDARFDAMLANGALDEVASLDARGLDPMLPAMKAHGVPWLCRHRRGELSLAKAAEEAKKDTKRYTKRQLTWFRHQMPGWTWVAPGDAMAEVERLIVES